MLLLLIVADGVAVVPAEIKEALLFETICGPAVLPALTVALLAIDDIEDIIRSGRLEVVTFAVMFAAKDSFCPLVPLPMKLTLEGPPETLAVTDELSFRPYPMR